MTEAIVRMIRSRSALIDGRHLSIYKPQINSGRGHTICSSENIIAFSRKRLAK